MPLELLQCVDDIIPDLGIVRGARCSRVKWFRHHIVTGIKHGTHSPGLGIKILDRWEFGSFGSRFFIGSLTSTNDEISSEDSS